MTSANLRAMYQARHDAVLQPMAARLERYLKQTCPAHNIDRISARPKSIDRFLAKAAKTDESGKKKYSDPMNQIQDQIGARIVAFYNSDVSRLCAEVERVFRPIEQLSLVPDSESEFGYFGKHYILFVPSDLYDEQIPPESDPQFFELQVKTLFQHAWAEAGHDLAYKPGSPLTSDQKRKVAFTAAQAWGADEMFDQLQRDLAVTRAESP